MDFLEKNDLLEETSIVTEQSKGHLTTLAQWINIAAIVSFVGLGISLVQLVMQFSKSRSGGYGSVGASEVFMQLIILGITLLLNITLFNAAKFLKTGLNASDQSYFNIGIRNLNRYFKIVGILLIVCLVFIALAFIIGIFVSASGGFRR